MDDLLNHYIMGWQDNFKYVWNQTFSFIFFCLAFKNKTHRVEPYVVMLISLNNHRLLQVWYMFSLEDFEIFCFTQRGSTTIH